MVEETIAGLYALQQMRCPVHLCIGQEAVAAGVCAQLRTADYLMSNHRSHGHYLAKGGDMKAMFAEIFGKATGCSGGKGGSMHLVDLTVNILGTTPIVGGVIPVAAGIAFGTVLQNKKRLSAVFMGEAAAEEGVFAETLNFCALKRLPVLFVCENNFFSVYSPLSVRQPAARSNSKLAAAYGIPAHAGDGNDVSGVYEAAGKAVRHIRVHGGPYYLEFKTYRWREHCGPNYDNDLGYRKESDFIKWRKRCPVENYQRKLLRDRILNSAVLEGMKSRISAEIAEAVRFAKESPFPPASDALSGVYSNR